MQSERLRKTDDRIFHGFRAKCFGARYVSASFLPIASLCAGFLQKERKSFGFIALFHVSSKRV